MNIVDIVGQQTAISGFGNLLPVPQYDQFAHIDKPLVTTAGIAALRDAWEAYERETDEWSNWGIKEFKFEFESGNPPA